MTIAIPTEEWGVVATLSTKKLVELLVALARGVRLSRYQKHQRGPKQPKPRRTATAFCLRAFGQYEQKSLFF